MWIDPKQLKIFLFDAGLLSQQDAEALLKEAADKKKSFEELLISSGKISEDDLRHAKAYILGIPFVDLTKLKVPPAVLFLIPEPVARNHNIVAFRKTEKELEVAMLDPADLEAIDFIKKKVGLKILPRLTDVASIKNVLLQYQKSLQAEFGEIVQKEALKLKALSEEDKEIGEAELKKMAEDLPVVKIVDTLLSHAIIQQASDIHIEPFEKEVVIRYRIDGVLHDAMTLPKNAAPGIVARIKVLSNLRLDEKRLPQDGRFKMQLEEEQGVSFRVSILPTYYGEKVVTRLLPDTVRSLTLEACGFHGEALERLQRAIKYTTGIVLITGPTGCGKSTTLYTLLEMLNTPDVNISTIEDPIEYQIPRISQSQVRPEIGLTFGNGLRALVRQDPDILMVGEIRDQETAGLAINAALTGHLVLSTLHTNSAAGAMPRLLDMKAEPFLLASTLKVVMAQRLVRRLTKEREKYFLSDSELKQLRENVNLDRVLQLLHRENILSEKTSNWQEIPFFKPKPSPEAEDGYRGRININEVLEMSAGIKELVMQSAPTDKIEEEAKREGMLTMIEDGIFKAVQGITTIEEVLRVVFE